jgi:hypothetical protein
MTDLSHIYNSYKIQKAKKEGVSIEKDAEISLDVTTALPFPGDRRIN